MTLGPLVVEWPESNAVDPVKLANAITRAQQQARSQAIDEAIKVVVEHKQRYGRCQMNVGVACEEIASRLEALKDTKDVG